MRHRSRVPATLLFTLVTAATLAAYPSGGASGAKPARAGDPSASSTRTISLNERANLHLTSKHGFTLNEQGAATGTFKGTIYVHLKIVSTKKVTAEVNIYPSSGGSISSTASAAYRREGAIGSFSGSLSIARGTGSYSHARGSGLSFSGTIAKSNDAVTVHVSGKASV
ncbi:MAG: hypothetical protein ACRDJ3_10060 [Solirubrobacteraceae bacterium]